MKNYINYLYLLNLSANEGNPDTIISPKEDRLYDSLQESLTKEQFALFEAFVDEYGDRKAQECEIYFERGFRFATRLLLECFTDKDIKEPV